jgi:hypothetical protein
MKQLRGLYAQTFFTFRTALILSIRSGHKMLKLCYPYKQTKLGASVFLIIYTLPDAQPVYRRGHHVRRLKRSPI